uniref:Uncharacterized protein n=1 Tax=Anguilla anguilla TaxID=7936 RepID=A0A0E9XNK5_ANGAN
MMNFHRRAFAFHLRSFLHCREKSMAISGYAATVAYILCDKNKLTLDLCFNKNKIIHPYVAYILFPGLPRGPRLWLICPD